MPAFENFERLAMSEAQFLRMAEAEYEQCRPTQQATPTFMQRFLFKSPSLGTNSIKNNSASASPALSVSSGKSPRMSMDGFGSNPHMSPNMSSGWGLGLVFRKRSGTNSSASSPRMGSPRMGSPRMGSPLMGSTSPSIGSASPRMGGAAEHSHKRSGSGGSHGSQGGKNDEFGLAKNKWVSQLF